MAKRKTRSRRGAGSVFWDKARNSYVGQLSLGYDPVTHRRKRGPRVYGATEAECWRKLDEQREELRKTGAVARRDTTVAQVVQAMLDSPPAEWRSPITLAVYTARAEYIKGAIGGIKLVRLTRAR
jgi:hypothetical protein